MYIKLIASEIFHKLNYFNLFGNKTHKEILENIRKYGCFSLDNFISTEMCEQLVQNAEDFMKSNSNIVKKESNGCDLRIYGIDKFTNTLDVPAVLDLSNMLFNEFSFNLNSESFCLLGKITAGKENLGSGGGWHRDSPYSHQFKTILYLNDVNEDNGPFQFIPKSHLYKGQVKASNFLGKSLDERRFSNDEITSLINNKIVEPPLTFKKPAGTLLIADTRGFHRGTPLNAGVRYALTRYYFSNGVDQKFFKN